MLDDTIFKMKGGTIMNDNLLSLYFSMESNKGIYALLLGSGISHSAGILTGWGILKDLCKQIMKLENPENEGDPIEWYKQKYEKDPLYDEVIELLAKSPSERNGLLRSYFEPDIDSESELKKPTQAHKSIAELVRSGYIKVIITTNFDRLMEQALDDLNVQYQTLYNESDIPGLRPLQHSDCTILKVHGDYRDTRFKNIADELSNYPVELTEILQQVFDNYGLVISGWSADWDEALKNTIRGVKGRRYSWYWHTFSPNLSQSALEIKKFRDANVIHDSEGADHFFTQLYTNVDSIRKLKMVNPDDTLIKIQILKKLIQENDEAGIRDLITQETKRCINFLEQIDYEGDTSREALQNLVKQIKNIGKPLNSLIATLAYFENSEMQRLLVKETLERFSDDFVRAYKHLLFGARQMLLNSIYYSAGISLVMKRDYKRLNEIFTETIVRNKLHSNIVFHTYVSHNRGLSDLFKFLDQQNHRLPVENSFSLPYMKEIFLINQLVINEDELEIYFDVFELIRSLKERHVDSHAYFSGLFGVKYSKPHLIQYLSKGLTDENWGMYSLFDNDPEKFKTALIRLASDLNQQMYFNGRDLGDVFK